MARKSVHQNVCTLLRYRCLNPCSSFTIDLTMIHLNACMDRQVERSIFAYLQSVPPWMRSQTINFIVTPKSASCWNYSSLRQTLNDCEAALSTVLLIDAEEVKCASCASHAGESVHYHRPRLSEDLDFQRSTMALIQKACLQQVVSIVSMATRSIWQLPCRQNAVVGW